MNKHSLGACVAGAKLDPKAVIEAQIDLVLHGLQTPAGAASASRPAKKKTAAQAATAGGDEALAGLDDRAWSRSPCSAASSPAR